ncbi:MAG: LOG family protein [Ignavibacteria bacterium]|nr:LOG family protein [Ignavibacteria bacterium]
MTEKIIVSVFGSSRTRRGDPEYSTAYDIGNLLVQAGMVVCNGGYGGIMEASAHGAKDAGGRTMGITTRSFPGLKANQWIDEEIPMETFIDRLMKLISVADGYVVLKGGTGTLLVLDAVLELMNKNMTSQKPSVVV